MAIIDQINRFVAQLTSSNDEFHTGTGNGYGDETGCGWNDLPLSPSGDDLCKTPPMKVRIRQTLMNLEQEHLSSSVQHPRSQWYNLLTYLKS